MGSHSKTLCFSTAAKLSRVHLRFSGVEKTNPSTEGTGGYYTPVLEFLEAHGELFLPLPTVFSRSCRSNASLWKELVLFYFFFKC